MAEEEEISGLSILFAAIVTGIVILRFLGWIEPIVGAMTILGGVIIPPLASFLAHAVGVVLIFFAAIVLFEIVVIEGTKKFRSRFEDWT